MLLRSGQLILHQADQLGREWPDVPAERVRRLDQRRVKDVMAAEDERIERNQSGRVKRLGFGHEPDGAGVAAPQRDGADDGRGCDGTARADEPHAKRLADGSPLTARHAEHLHGRTISPEEAAILGLTRRGVKASSHRTRRACTTCGVALYSQSHRRLMRDVASTKGDEKYGVAMWRSFRAGASRTDTDGRPYGDRSESLRRQRLEGS